MHLSGLGRTLVSSRAAFRAAFLLFALVLLSAFAASAFAQQDDAVAQQPSFAPAPAHPKRAPGRLLVRFRPGTPDSAANAAHAALGARLLRRSYSVPRLHVVQLPAGLSVSDALARYRRNPSVAYAQPDRLAHLVETLPNDPSFSSLWGLKNTGQSGGLVDADIDATDAWALTTGSNSVYVGVIDTGVDYNHPDLAGNVYSSPSDCNTNGLDDDNDGYIDNCHGLDAANNDGDPMDDHSHGTHVSGTIGATGNNSLGVVGVNWRVTIVPCKFLAADGYGWDSDAIQCLDWYARLKDHGMNLVATSNSWSGSDFDQALYDAIAAQKQRGILLIAAASNDSSDNDFSPRYPANYALANTVTVAATDRWDQLASFSNWGARTVDLGGPGVAILSTTPSNSYASYSGTSMATPHVSGAVALLKARNPALGWQALRNLLLASGDPLPALQARTISGRRLNVYSAMTCSNHVLIAPVSPAAGLSVPEGALVTFSVLSLNCANPYSAGATVTIDNNLVLPLADDGQNGDEAAGDGVFSGRWTATNVGPHTYQFPNNAAASFYVVSGYNAAVPTAYSWRSSATNNLGLDDEDVAQLDLTGPGLFPVMIGGAPVTRLAVGSNGLISNAGFNDYLNSTLPAGDSDSTIVIAPWWDDLLPIVGTSQNVFWGVSGSAPNRELVVEWRDVDHWDLAGQGTVRFQVVLSESSPTSDIIFNYAHTDFWTDGVADEDHGGSATVGVQSSPSTATQYSYYQPVLTDGMALLFQTDALPAPTIAVTSPNGGEAWALGTSHTIQWTYSGNLSRVKIELIKNGVRWSTLAADAPAGSGGIGSFNWSINPALPAGADYRIRVTSNTPAGASDSSDAPFTLAPPPASLTVTSPNGGESWALGSSHSITWTYSGAIGSSVKIQLLKNGVVWSTLATGAPAGSAGSGSFNWTINPALALGVDYRIRVTSVATPAILDASNANFALTAGGTSSLTVTSPNGGESWALGSSHPITWSYTGSPGSSVKIQLLKNGVVWSTIATSAPLGSAGSGSYNWTINSALAAAADYKVRVSSTTNTAIADASNANFALTAGGGSSLTVTAPNGGESWALGSSHPITWSYTGSPGSSVKIQLLKNGVVWSTIISSTPLGSAGTGSYNWTINSALAAAADYKVRVSSTTNTAIADASNANFSLTAGGTQLLQNPGFESGAVAWVASPYVIDNSNLAPAHSGSWKAWLGGYGQVHTDTLYQAVALPGTATSITLSCWLFISSAEDSSAAYDTMRVQLRNTSGALLTTLASYSNLNANNLYVQKSFNITAYKGQTVRVYFDATEDSSSQTSFLLDDCAVNKQ